MRARSGGLALLGFVGLMSVAMTGFEASAQEQAATPAPAAPTVAVPATARTARASYSNLPRSTLPRLKARRQAVAGGRYFIEFRSRYALSYGHTFAAFGRLNARGQITQFEVAGLHPAGESSVPWMLGHLVPVVSETGPSDGDLDEKYISARYRVTLTEDQYAKVVAKIRQMQASTPLWSATVYNCNAFVGDIARFMGLSNNTSPLQVPEAYITSLRRINNGQSTIAPGAI